MKTLIALTLAASLSTFSTDAFCQNLSFTSIREIPAVIKRGKTYEINWTGGVSDEPVTIQLTDKNGVTKELNAIANTGQHSIHIPNETKPGKYSLRLVSIQSGEVAVSKELLIKRRIPLIVQLSPLIAIPVILFITNDRPQKETDFSDPPTLPND